MTSNRQTDPRNTLAAKTGVLSPARNLEGSAPRMRRAAMVLILFAALLSLNTRLTAYTFKTINFPGATSTQAYGINAFAQIVGTYNNAAGQHGFLYSGGKFTTLDYPGATSTTAFGINNAGQIVGVYNDPNGGGSFLYSGGVFTKLSVNDPRDINNSGEMAVGGGFVDGNGTFTAINYPGAPGTDPFGINDLSQIVGLYFDTNFTPHGFLYSSGTYSTIDFTSPNIFWSYCWGINNHGQIVGEYTDRQSALHGYTYSAGTFTGFDFPGTISGTEAHHVNDFGQIVGVYTTGGTAYTPNGFLASPSPLNPVPLINQPLMPESAAPGSSGFTLTTNGTGFVSGAQVYWNGSPRQTFFGTSEKLTATITSSDVAVAGTASVTVVNPAPGGGASNVQFFQITTPVPSITLSENDVPAGSSPQREVAADFNRDGKLDLAVADGANNEILVLLGNGDGTFQSPAYYATGSNPSYLVTGDFNGDGNIDIAVADYNGNTVSILLGNGNGTFQTHADYPTGGGPFALIAGDFNGDGRLDLATVNNTGNTVSILLGNGDGTFQPRADLPADTEPRSIATGDFNRDGILDLAVGNFGNFGGNTVSVFLGNGDGTFQPKVDYATNGGPLSIVTADFNGDGKLDLAVDNSCGVSAQCGRPGTVSILLGNGDGTFQTHVDYAAGWFPYTIIAGDFNGDGKLDVAVADLDSNQIYILQGAGDGTFPNSTRIATIGGPVGILAGDFNGDGKLDFALGSGSAVAIMLQNEVYLPTVTALTLNPASVLGGSNSTGTVTLSGPAPTGGATVTLSSSNPSAASIPAPGSVTVPAAATTATFTVNSQPVGTNTSATISATYNNSTQTATLAVQAATMTSFALSPTTVIGGKNSIGTVTLNGPAPAGAAVNLSSSDPRAASVPATVTISGATATATVTTQPVSSTTSVTISATYGGVTKTVPLTVQAATLVSLTLNPASPTGGKNSIGTVTLSGPAPTGGAVVSLSSSNPAVASIPAPGTITVAAGATTAAATITTQIVTTSTPVTISATYSSITKTATLTVQPAALASLALSPRTLLGGKNSTATVTLTGPAPAGGVVVTLSSSNPGVASVPPPGSITVPGGATTATGTITTQPVSTTTSLTISASYHGITRPDTLSVLAAGLTSVALSPASLTGGSSSTATVTLSGEAPAAGDVVTLSSSNPSVAQLPGSVTVLGNATTATVTVTTQPVSTTTSVTIYAKYGAVTRTATLSVKAPALVSIAVNPTSVAGGANSTATVTLSGPAPAAGVVVALSSSNTAAATVPASLTVPGGATTGSAIVNTKAVASSTVVNIIAKYGGATKSAVLTVQ